MSVSRHDRKRAERFEAAGVGEADLPFAAASYLGDEGGECSLCDHALKYLYLLSFHRPDGTTVEFFPVGSKCITDWVKAMPEGVARREALARIKAAEKAMRDQRKVLKKLTDAGDEDGANLMRIFFRLPEAVRASGDGPLSDIGSKVVRFGSFYSDKQRRFFAGLVRRAARAAGVDDRARPGSGRQAAAAPASAPSASDATQASDDGEPTLGQRYRALTLPLDQRHPALVDIAERAERYGGFASDRQAGYFEALLRQAEDEQRRLGDIPPPPPPQPELFSPGSEDAEPAPAPVAARATAGPSAFEAAIAAAEGAQADYEDEEDDPF